MKVPYLRVKRLRDREIEAVTTHICKSIMEYSLPAEIFGTMLHEITSLLGDFQEAMNRQRKNELTAELRRIDTRRNREYHALLKGIDYFQMLSDPPKVEAALELQEVLGRYGKSLSRESDIIETVKLRTLMDELRHDELATALERLSLTDTIDRLHSANEQFDTLYLKRATVEAEDTTPLLAPTRQLLVETINLLISNVSFYNRIEPENYADIAAELTEIIGDIMALAKTRKTRVSQKEDAEFTGELVSVEAE